PLQGIGVLSHRLPQRVLQESRRGRQAGVRQRVVEVGQRFRQREKERVEVGGGVGNSAGPGEWPVTTSVRPGTEVASAGGECSSRRKGQSIFRLALRHSGGASRFSWESR